MSVEAEFDLYSVAELVPDELLYQLENLFTDSSGTTDALLFYAKSAVVVVIMLVILYTAIDFIFFDA